MSESQAQPAEVATARPVPGWAKPARVLLGAMAVSAAAFLTTLPTWIRAEVSTVVSTSTLDISGADAGSTVSALALVALVASVALRIAGPKLRKVLALLLVGVGLGLAVAAFGVNADPQAASMAQVSAMTGTNAPANSYAVTAMPLWRPCAVCWLPWPVCGPLLLPPTGRPGASTTGQLPGQPVWLLPKKRTKSTPGTP